MGRFTRDPRFERELLASPGIYELVADRTAAAARVAADQAPDDPRTGSPDLHSSVFSDVSIGARGVVGRVGATDYKAPWFEEGASNVRAQPFLRPAVEQEIGPVEAGEDPE